MRGPGGHQRCYVKLRRRPMTRLCPFNVVFRWDQGKVSISGVPRGLRTKFRRQGCVWGGAPHPFLTGCCKKGHGEAKLRSGDMSLSGLSHFESLQLQQSGERDTKEPKQGLLTHPYGGGWTDVLNLASTKHRRNISRVKNKYSGPSLGMVRLHIQSNWLKMKHFSLETYCSIRHDLTLERWKELTAGYDDVIRFQGNSETRDHPPFIKGCNCKSNLQSCHLTLDVAAQWMLRSRWSALGTTQVTPQASSRCVYVSRAAGIRSPESRSLWWRTSRKHAFGRLQPLLLLCFISLMSVLEPWEGGKLFVGPSTHSLLLWPPIITAASTPQANVLPQTPLPPPPPSPDPGWGRTCSVYLSDLHAQHGTCLAHVKLLRMGWKKKQMKKENVRNKQGLKLDECFHFIKDTATKKWIIIFSFELFVLG